MPRIARKYLTGTFFHIMSQGINKESIFKDEKYKNEYKKLMKKFSKEYNVDLIAYCIMDNHVHILIHSEEFKNISSFMKKVNCNYAIFYNKTNERVGYVFRDRFYTVSMNNLMQIYTCIVYIHNNPVKAEIVNNTSDYYYSSYNEYFNKNSRKNIISNKTNQLLFEGLNYQESKNLFERIHKNKEIILKNIETESEIEYNEIINVLKSRNLSMNEIILKMKNKYKISERELVKITNLNRYEIRKILQNK